MSVLPNLALLAFVSAGGEGGGGLLDVNPGMIFWTVITFVILLLILRKLAWKPILTSLTEREKFIEDSLKKAETAQKDAEKMLQDNKEAIRKAEEEAQDIVAQGREYAETLKAQMLVESKEEAKKMIDDAKAEIERKNKEAFNQLKGQIAGIAVDAAEKIIRQNLDKEKQQELVNKYIDDLPKN